MKWTFTLPFHSSVSITDVSIRWSQQKRRNKNIDDGEKGKRRKKNLCIVVKSGQVTLCWPSACPPQNTSIWRRLCCFFFSFRLVSSDAFRAVLGWIWWRGQLLLLHVVKDKRHFFWHTIFYSISFLCPLWDAFATINFLTNFLPIFGGNIACVFLPVSQLEVSSKFERASSSPGKELFRFSPRSLSQRRKIVI